jgi:hypothetical protein
LSIAAFRDRQQASIFEKRTGKKHVEEIWNWKFGNKIPSKFLPGDTAMGDHRLHVFFFVGFSCRDLQQVVEEVEVAPKSNGKYFFLPFCILHLPHHIFSSCSCFCKLATSDEFWYVRGYWLCILKKRQQMFFQGQRSACLAGRLETTFFLADCDPKCCFLT